MALALRLRNATFGSGSYNRAEVTWWNAGRPSQRRAGSQAGGCWQCGRDYFGLAVSALPVVLISVSTLNKADEQSFLHAWKEWAEDRRVNDQIAVVGGLKMSA